MSSPATSFWRARELALVARLFVLTAGKAAAWRTLPLYLAVFIVSLVLFGGHGMDAATVTGNAERELGFRVALLASWALSTLPTTRVWLGTPETFFIRALPVSGHGIVGILGLGCVVVHGPWAVLWLRGAGPWAALWAVATAAALQASTIMGLRRPVDVALLALASCFACAGPSWSAALLAAAVFACTLSLAWSRAPERSPEGRGWVSSRGPLAAEITALGVALYRGYSPVLLRAALFGVGAAWLAVVGIAHGAAEELGVTALCLSFWAPAASFGAAALAGPVLRIERSLEWILRASGAPPRVGVAPALLLASLSAGVGAAFAAIVAAAGGLGLARGLGLASGCATAGAAVAIVACSLLRRVSRGDGHDAGRIVLVNLASLSAWVAVLVTLGARALPIMALVSLAALAWERMAVQRKAGRTC